jgi:hypothetical protein
MMVCLNLPLDCDDSLAPLVISFAQFPINFCYLHKHPDRAADLLIWRQFLLTLELSILADLGDFELYVEVIAGLVGGSQFFTPSRFEYPGRFWCFWALSWLIWIEETVGVLVLHFLCWLVIYNLLSGGCRRTSLELVCNWFGWHDMHQWFLPSLTWTLVFLLLIWMYGDKGSIISLQLVALLGQCMRIYCCIFLHWGR